MQAVMVHGAGGGGWEWRLWAEVFRAGGWKVMASDLEPVSAGLAATRFDDYRGQVCDWCRTASTPVALVGASLGGLLALSVADECPPAALIVVNPMPPDGLVSHDAFSERPPIIGWSRSTFAATRVALPDAALSAIRIAHGNWRDESGVVLNEARAGIRVAPPSCPSLVMAAVDDGDILPATSRAVADALGADFVVIPDAGHVGILVGHRATRAAALALAWLNARVSDGNLD